MKIKIIVVAITLSLLLSGLVIAVGGETTDGDKDIEESEIELASFAGGNGTSEDPYLIENVTQLQAMNEDLSAHYALANDINASETRGWNDGSGFMPVGEFLGGLDGRNHTVGGLYINRPDKDYVGLIEFNIGAVVKNIGLIDVDINGDNNVGAIGGENVGTVSNSYATGNVSGDGFVGGLVGENSGRVENSYATGNVSGKNDVGGLVGENYYGTVSNSHYNIDSVLINDGNKITIGGLFDEQYQDWIGDMELDIQDYNDTLIPSGDHYEIGSGDGLRDLLGFADNEGYDFHLSSDIDMSEEPGLYIPYLAADFDGDNHTISNLNIHLPFASHIGMFGYLKGGNVTDVEMVDVDISGNDCVGGLVGVNRGLFENSDVTGNVSGRDRVGGLVGDNSGTVKNSYVTGYVSGNDRVGGLAGVNHGMVSNSYATGNVSGQYDVGALVGNNRATVSNISAAGNVSGYWRVGVLVGGNSGTIENSDAAGNVSGNKYVGGLVGKNWDWATVSNSYAVGDVTGEEFVGGLVGQNPGNVSNSYATGNVTGEFFVGGAVGGNSGTVSNSFWDIETSGMNTSDVGTGKTTAKMKDIETYTDTSTEGLDEPWDFVGNFYDDDADEDIWNIDEEGEINDGYPFLGWKEPGEEPPNVTYELTVDVEGEGTVQIDPDQDGYEHGTEVTITASPEDGSEFVNWTGDAVGTDTTINITMDEDKEITANFEKSNIEVAIIEPKEGKEFQKEDEIQIEFEIDNLEDEEIEIVLIIENDERIVKEKWEGEEIKTDNDYQGNYSWKPEDEGEYNITVAVNGLNLDVRYDKDIVSVTVKENADGIPGFTTTFLLVAVLMAEAIYRKKRR